MLILQNATAVQFVPAQVQEGVDIAIDGEKILEVGRHLAAKYTGADLKVMQGKIVMPGLVCAHHHFYSGLSRGIMAHIAPCPDFVSTLNNLWWRLDRALDEESLYYSATICALEAIRHGCSAVIDHHASPNYIRGSLKTLRSAFNHAGLRGMTCFETTNRNAGLSELEQGVEENIAFALAIDAEKQPGKTPLVESHIGAHAPFTLCDDGLRLLKSALETTGRGLHIHVAEDRYDVSHSHAYYDLDPLVRLDAFGLLDSKTLIAHGLYLSAEEIKILNRQKATLVHNPRSNMNNQVGYNHRLPAMQRVALGTDGIGADMFEEMKFAWFKHRDAGGSMWPDSYLKMLHHGNTILNDNFSAQFGAVAAGYQADLTVLDYLSPTPLQAENLAGHFAFGINSSHVDSVMVNGVMVYENKAFPHDVEVLYREAQGCAAQLWKRMDALA